MKEAARFLWHYLKRYRSPYAPGFGARIMKDALGAALPLLIRYAIDGLTAGSALTILLLWAGAIVAEFVALFAYTLAGPPCCARPSGRARAGPA